MSSNILIAAATASAIFTQAPQPPVASWVQADNCVAVGQMEAANRGGRLSNARQAVQNGRQVCRIVIVIPASNGQRARRVEVIVPQR